MSKVKPHRDPLPIAAKTVGGVRLAPPSLLECDFAPVVFALFTGLMLMAGLIFAIGQWYHPDTQPLVKEALELVTPKAARDLAPEPVERLRFLASVLLTPIFLLGCVFAFRRLYRATTESTRRLGHWLAMAALCVATVALPVISYQALEKSNFLYVRAGVLYTSLDVYLLLLFPCFALLWFYSDKRWAVWVGRVGIYGLSALLAVITVFAVLFDRDSIAQYTYHINPVIYPLAQVLAGKTLLVNCAPLYGLYPHFLQPFYSVCPLNVYSITALMAALLLVSLAGMWVFLRAVTKNDFIFLAGFVAAVFYCYAPTRMMISDALRPDPYYQYAPLRTLFPGLLLALSALYLRGIRKRLVYYTTFLCCALATLWNLDSGIAVFGSWVLLLGYTELFEKPLRAAVKPILKHGLVSLGSLFLVYGGYSLFTVLRSGHWPNWRMTANYYKLFSHYGYFMLPMPSLPHTWGIVALVFIVGMVLALNGLFRKEHQTWCASLFLLAVMGTGLFAYYQGRSHDNCLISIVYIPILMITLLADHVLGAAKAGNRAYYKFVPLAALCFFFCVSAVPSVFAQSARFTKWVEVGSSARPAGSQGVHSKNIAFLRQHTTPGERVFILLPGEVEGMYHAESSTACALDLPASNDWFFKSDIEQVLNFLQSNKSTKVFAIPGQYQDLTGLFQSAYRVEATEPQTGLALLRPVGSASTSSKP